MDPYCNKQYQVCLTVTKLAYRIETQDTNNTRNKMN